MVRVIVGASSIGETGKLWTVTEVIKFSEEEVSFPKMVDVCRVDPVSTNHLENMSETGDAEGELLCSDISGDESRITSVSKKKKLSATGLLGSREKTVSPEVFETELSFSNWFRMNSFLLDYSGSCSRRKKKTFQFQFQEKNLRFQSVRIQSRLKSRVSSQNTRDTISDKQQRCFCGQFGSNFVQFRYREDDQLSGVGSNGSEEL